jgi:hypothetical protein
MRAFSRAAMRLPEQRHPRIWDGTRSLWGARRRTQPEKARSLRVCRVVLDPHAFALFMRDDGVLPETERAATPLGD